MRGSTNQQHHHPNCTSTCPRFVPLKQTREFKANELMDHYLEHDQKLRKFVPIIKDSIVYPVIYDANRTVLSLPPIINGSHSAITLDTRDVFIECTATDLTKAQIVLNTVCCMFAEYCEVPFEVEPVEVRGAGAGAGTGSGSGTGTGAGLTVAVACPSWL